MAETLCAFHRAAARVEKRIAALAGYGPDAFNVVDMFMCNEYSIDISRICPKLLKRTDYPFRRKSGVDQDGTAFCHYYV
jgi:hypothetical protein